MTNVITKEQPTKAQLSRWRNQEKIVFAAFFNEPSTMFMVEKKTGIMRPNICRFVATWKKKNCIHIVRTAKDPHTKCNAQFLSTNPAYAPSAQIKMFE